MTHNHELEIRCQDCLDEYCYVLFYKDQVVLVEYHEDLFNYGVVTLNGDISMLLRESHAEANKLVDPAEPNIRLVTVNHI